MDSDPDPDRDGENGSGTDPSSIKSSQNKGDNKLVFYNFLLDLYYIIITSLKKTEILTRKNVTWEMKLTEIIPNADPRIRFSQCGSVST